MNKIILISIAVFLSESSLFAQVKNICLSYDDMPVVTYGISDTTYQKALMNKLASSLQRNHIPAIGFVIGSKLCKDHGMDAFQIRLLELWLNHGLELGNHSFSHPDYNQVSCESYTNDILKAGDELKPFLKSRGKKLKYFRHPFLHVGSNAAKADSLQNFLNRNGYTVAPVTIDNEDYLFALAYKRAGDRQDSALMKKIGHDFVDYIGRKIKYYEKQCLALFGRNVNHILLLHASKMNADYADSFAAMLKENQYHFISMDQALTDEAYLSPITVYGKWGISWIDKWALSKGKKGEFFRDEPSTPEYIRELAK